MMAYVYQQYYTNKYNENNQFFNYVIKNGGSPLLAQNEVRADIFSGSLAVFASQSEATISSFSLAANSFNSENWDSKDITCLSSLSVDYHGKAK
jgi:hypothetical protein